jgi:ketopantoate reductase
MYRDLNKGLPVEAEAIVEDLLAHGKAHGVSTPLLARLCESLDLSAGARARHGPAPPVEKTVAISNLALAN